MVREVLLLLRNGGHHPHPDRDDVTGVRDVSGSLATSQEGVLLERVHAGVPDSRYRATP